MEFYNATSKRAICQTIDRQCDSSDTSYPRLDKTAEVNDGLEELVGKIIAEMGNSFWEWDDTNQTDLPVGTGLLIEGQESYSFAAEYLAIKRIKVKDNNGKWHPLRQIDQQDFDEKGYAIEQWFGTDSSGNPNKGLPEFYDILGDTLRLYPAPTSTSVTLTAGLKVDFIRTAVLFTAVSTTAADATEPGLPSPYHKLLAYYASIPYCMKYKKDRVAWLEKKWDEGVEDLLKHLSKRNPDKRTIMKMKKINYI